MEKTFSKVHGRSDNIPTPSCKRWTKDGVAFYALLVQRLEHLPCKHENGVQLAGGAPGDHSESLNLKEVHE